MKAMILAAGHGERMQPLSTHAAKPALPVLDEPLVLRLVRQLAAQGVEAVVVNAHAHPASLRRALAEAPIPVELLVEPVLRGSGGGIRGARHFLAGQDRFVVINGDMVVDLDLPSLLRAHACRGAAVTLALRDDPRKRAFGTIGYDDLGRVCRITDLAARGDERGNALFIGVHVLESAIFDRMPRREVFEIISDLYAPLLRHGEAIGSWLQPPDAVWWPVGSPRQLLEANLAALGQARDAGIPLQIAPSARVEGDAHAPAWIGAGARVEAGAVIGPWAVVGARARVGRGTRLEHSLLLPDARPRPGSQLHRAIGHGDEVWADA